METFIAHLTDQISNRFQNAQLSFDTFPGGQVGGVMAWSGYDGVAHRERQRSLWNVLRELPVEEQRRISSVLTLTPHEQQGYLENATEDDF
ncbi:MAG: hypothetical protein H7Y38_02925 [Armatimonadetes bacterium]|nr:hypothetical protein [Armatimonadota bacterium]